MQAEGLGDGIVCLIQNVSIVPLLTMALCISFPHWELVSELRWRGFFEGLSQDEGQADFSETSAPLSLIRPFK
jgi:hypothetical protein